MADALLDALCEELNNVSYSDFSSVVCFDFRGDGRYFIDCRNRPVRKYTDPENTTADCTLTASFDVLQGILTKKSSFMSAMVTGKIRVSGDKSALGGIGRAWRNITTKNSIIPAGDMVEADSEREPVRRTEAAIRSSAANADVAKILAKRVWIQDTERSACHKCNASFHIFLRRHHCRLCGDIFCDACSSFVWEPYGKRVCGSCYFTIIPSIGRAAAGPDNVITTAGKTLHRDGAATDGFKDDLGEDGDETETSRPLLLTPLSEYIIDQQRAPISASTNSPSSGKDRKVVNLMESMSKLNTHVTSTTSTVRFYMLVVPITAMVIGFAFGQFSNADWVLLVSSVWHHARGVVEYVAGRDMSTLASWTAIAAQYWYIAAAVAVLAAAVYYVQDLLLRRLRVYAMAGVVFVALRYMKSTEGWRAHLSPADNDARWNRVHDFLAARVLAQIRSLRGFWVKAGQYLSSRADVMPPPWVHHLSKLQDEMPCGNADEVKDTIRREFGKSLDELFVFFDEQPLGAASIAQVHRAILRATGEEVVIKVQHKGIGALMRQDLINMERIVSWVAYAEPEFDFKPIMNEWAKVAIDELDFKNEAANQQRIAENLKTAQVNVIVPRIISLDGKELVTNKVIVMEYCSGFKVTDTQSLDHHNVDREALMKRICQAYAAQVYRDGLFNCDPHPGNILVHVEDGSATPVLLDFGMTKKLTDKSRLAFAKLVFSAASLDFGGLLNAFDDMGLKLKRDDPMEDMQNIRFVLRDTAPPTESRQKLKEFREERWKQRQELPRSQRNPVEAWPPELLFFFRVTLLLRGLCSVLDVRLRYMSVLKPYAHVALVESYPKESHALRIVHEHGEGRGGNSSNTSQSTGAALRTAVLARTKETSRDRLERRLKALLRRMHAQGSYIGTQVAVYHKGEVVAEVCAGTLGNSDPRPVQHSTLFNCFSVTKAVAAVALHQLIDRGTVRLHDRVSQHWPAFACHGKETCTVEHVLTHRAGLQRAGVGADITLKTICSWDAMLEEMANATPADPPGQRTAYHIMSFGWLVGGLVQGASQGTFLRHFVRDNIAAPLGVADEFRLGFDDDEYAEDAATGVRGRIATLKNAFVDIDNGVVNKDSIRNLMHTLRSQHGDGLATGGGKSRDLINPANPNTAATHQPVRHAGEQDPTQTSRVGAEDTAVETEAVTDDDVAGVADADVKGTRAFFAAQDARRAGLRAPYAALAEQIIADMLRATIDPRADDEWAQFSTTNNVTSWKKKEQPGSGVAVRGRTRMNVPIQAVLDILAEKPRKKEWDETFVSEDLIEDLSLESKVVRQTVKAIWPVSGRDFLALQHAKDFPDGKLVIAGTAVTHDNCPPNVLFPRMLMDHTRTLWDKSKSIVRGECILSGFVFRPLDDGKACEVDFVSIVDLKGSVPSFIIQFAAKSQPQNLFRLRTIAEREWKPPPPTPVAPRVVERHPNIAPTAPRERLHHSDDVIVEATSTERCDVPAKFAAMCDEMVRNIAEDTIGNDAKAHWVRFDHSAGVTMWRRKESLAAGVAVRGMCRIAAPPAAVLDVLSDTDGKLNWTEKLNTVRIIQDLGKNTHVEYQKLSGIWPVCERDFCAIHHRRRLTGDHTGTVVHAIRSVTPEMIGSSVYPPPAPGAVRGTVLDAGFVVVPVDDARASIVHYVSIADLKGNIPMFVLQFASKSQPGNLARLRKIVEPFYASNRAKYDTQREADDSADGTDQGASVSGPSRDGQDATTDPGSNAVLVDLPDTGHSQSSHNHGDLGQLEQITASIEGIAGTDQVGGKKLKQSLLMDPCIFNTDRIRKACIPSANGHFSARALAKFYAALANKGSIDGVRLLSHERVVDMAKARGTAQFASGMPAVSWGLGVRKFGIKSPTGDVRTSAFGHGGVGGSIGFCDPDAEFAMAVTVNKLTLTGEHSQAVIDFVLRELEIGEFVR